jgi:serine/threonine protein kinase
VAKLIIQSGPGIGTDQTIAGTLVVGRLQTCDLQITEQKSSRKHFQIEQIGSSFQIKDLGSRNGTELNDKPLTKPILLSNGDIVGVGGTRLVFFLDAPSLAKGDSFGAYQIVSTPTPCACGYRFRARQRSLDRDVVLEMLSLEYRDNSEVSDRFIDMMSAASHFDHPNILEVYEVNKDKGVAFATMPRFEGTTLRRSVRSGHVTLADAMKVLVHVADALVHINNRKKIHGRLSPSTILVSEDDYRVKLIGFGTDPRGRCTDPALPEAEWHAGFCSPEVGRGMEATASSDLYSLGAIAYWLVTGHVPYRGESAMDILRQHASPNPVVPSRELMPDLPPMIGRAIDRLLKKSPSERPENSRTAKKLMENALEVSREKPGKISKIHSRPRAAQKISSEDLAEVGSGSSTASLGPKDTTITQKRHKTPSADKKKKRRGQSSETSRRAAGSERKRQSVSSERSRRAAPDSNRLKVSGGISDRLVSPETLGRGHHSQGSVGSWIISMVFIILLYIGSYFVTLILLKLAETS